MRIYDLAKAIGQHFGIDVKSAKLADEFRSMPEFADIHDQIKSHSSSVEDKHAKLMYKIYEDRLAQDRAGKQRTPAQDTPAPARPAAPAAEPRAVAPGKPAPAQGSVQPVVAPPRPVAPARPVAPVPTPRPAPPPRPAPILPTGSAPGTPIPAVRRPAPIQAPGARPVAQQPQAASAPAPVAPPAPAASAAPAAEAAPARPVAPAAPPAQARPIAPAPSGVKPAPLLKPGMHAGSLPIPAPGAQPPAGPGQPPRPAPPIPSSRMGQRPGSAPPQGQRPAGPPPQRPMEPRAAEPRGGEPRQGEFRRGEPRQGEDRPREFRQGGGGAPGTRPVAPGSMRTGQPTGQQGGPGRPQDRQGPQGPQGGQGRSQGQQKFRPSGLASELRSSSGTTGIMASPETGRGQGLPPMARTAGQPAAPPPPKFSADSPFTTRPVRKPTPPPGGAFGDRAGGRGRAGEGGPGGDRGKSQPLTAEQITLPEIGVMKLKGAPKRHRPAPTAAEKARKGGKPGESEAAKAAKKGLRPSKVYGDADEFRRPLKVSGKRPRQMHVMDRREEVKPVPAGPVVITGPLTVGEFAQKINFSPAEIIKRAFLKGKILTINKLIDFELAEELAIELDVDLVVRQETEETDIADYRVEDRPEDLVARPPVVTIMGHVDHGKTSILDFYRRSRVVEGEFGGITQHIGAYHVSTDRGDIVFLDTPGHEAFTAMRARGVQCTDIVVLVVSADDGVMPQTIEAIHHAQAGNVPIIVAINKIDLPQARPERVRTELLQYNLVSPQLGGTTEFVEISAKQGTNMENLLEIISIQAEVLDLKGNPTRPAEGIVIEAHVDPLRGSVATILVQKGTLHVGDSILVGQETGRVRAMFTDRGEPVHESTLSQPIELIGLGGAPQMGQSLLAIKDEQKAREIAERREQRRRLLDLGTTRHVTLAGLRDLIAEGKVKELAMILKADVQGSVEAIRQTLEKLSTAEIRVNIIHSGTGSITENDVNLAMASSAMIVGFNVRPELGAAEMAQREGIEIKLYRIIYELKEEVEKALLGMLDKRYKENIVARVEIRKIFRVSHVGTIAGCMVLSGEIHRNHQVRLVRDGTVVYEGKIAGLRRVKEDVSKVAAGHECGVALERFQDVKEGDIIEAFTMEELPPDLART